jgi:oligoribonuclease
MTAHVVGMTINDTAPGPLAYLWEDGETTGLDNDCDLLEISVIATDKHLNELEVYTTLVRPQSTTFEQIASNEIVERMHRANGLLDDLHERGADAPTVGTVETSLIAMIERHRDPAAPPVRLAGGGVSHFDFPYLKAQMPRFTDMLHYRPLDISQVAQAYTDATGSLLFGEKTGKAHRAEADIREDLDRARQFWEMFRAIDAQMNVHPRDGRESVLAGVEIIRAFEGASEGDDLAAGYAQIRELLDQTRAEDALAGVTAVASHLIGMLSARSGVTVDDILQAARRDLIRHTTQNVRGPRM